ncbi:MAG: hypothetical protein WCP55_07220, partial [Lentisphaerota bacterium]
SGCNPVSFFLTTECTEHTEKEKNVFYPYFLLFRCELLFSVPFRVLRVFRGLISVCDVFRGK